MTTRHEIKSVDAKPFPPGSFAQEGMPITMLVGTDSYAGVVQSVSEGRRKITVTVGKKVYYLTMRTDGNYWLRGKPIGYSRRFSLGYHFRAMVNGKWTMLSEKEHKEWLKKWCGFCQESPCIGEGCRLQGKKLARLGFLSSWAYRSDSEQAEVEELSKEFPDTGWPIVKRKESP